jgi:hypothetical protein
MLLVNKDACNLQVFETGVAPMPNLRVNINHTAMVSLFGTGIKKARNRTTSAVQPRLM